MGGDHPLNVPACRVSPLTVALKRYQQRLERGFNRLLGFDARQARHLGSQNPAFASMSVLLWSGATGWGCDTGVRIIAKILGFAHQRRL
jgi:hypothetical protein